MKEEWRAVPGYEGLYEVSNMGRVRSLDREVRRPQGSYMQKGCVLKPGIASNGYYTVSLRKGKGGETKTVHRLVATVFIPNPNNLPCVNHKDEDRLNNSVCNLEWCTQKYNTKYGTAQSRLSVKKSFAVEQYDLQDNYIRTFPTVREAAEAVGVTSGVIVNCIRGEWRGRRYLTGGGYKWKRKTD